MTEDERLTDIEMAITNQQKTIDELNEVVIQQGKIIDRLLKDYRFVLDLVKTDNVKPLSEETPPPHY